ncbi:MAG: hypothetical protein EOO54_20605 [Haliea sp.]|nr:MAG: hypothetical protein EOO54_20605 [Haliea sp.]
MTALRPITGRYRTHAWAVLCVAAALLTACAGAPFGPGEGASPFRSPNMTMAAAQQLVAPGRTTKADVLAALGPATVVRFDSGFEVWAYRDKPVRQADSPAELVMLFTPSGVVQKVRAKPAYAAPAR